MERRPVIPPYAGIIFGAFLFIVVFFLKWETVLNLYEDAADAIAPSAQRAFALGERHFNASDPAAYDIDRAEHFFLEAASWDPKSPYVYHELARIYFLKGDFSAALGFINAQIALHSETTPNSYYVRGLIEGYMGRYDAAAKDYEHFLRFDPVNWAALNDYAWVLVKARRFSEARDVTAKGLVYFPANPWLLNSNATAAYELGDYGGALTSVRKAFVAVGNLTETEWLHAYPGNDPKIAGEGIASFKRAVAQNMHSIELALASSAVQLR